MYNIFKELRLKLIEKEDIWELFGLLNEKYFIARNIIQTIEEKEFEIPKFFLNTVQMLRCDNDVKNNYRFPLLGETLEIKIVEILLLHLAKYNLERFLNIMNS